MTYATVQMNLKDVVTEIGQTQSDKCCVITKTEIPRVVSWQRQKAECLLPAAGEKGDRQLLDRYGDSVLEDEKSP